MFWYSAKHENELVWGSFKKLHSKLHFWPIWKRTRNFPLNQQKLVRVFNLFVLLHLSFRQNVFFSFLCGWVAEASPTRLLNKRLAKCEGGRNSKIIQSNQSQTNLSHDVTRMIRLCSKSKSKWGAVFAQTPTCDAPTSCFAMIRRRESYEKKSLLSADATTTASTPTTKHALESSLQVKS